jgi:cobalt-zinc-cadmium efflux system membrane fusion protein
MGAACLVEDSAMRRPIFLLFTLACSGQTTSRAKPAVETGSLTASSPSIATADTATVDLPLALHSQLYVEHDATIYARSPGVVESILVDLGSRVTAGQRMARLESADQRIALDQAQEKLTNARQMVQRQRTLKAGGFITQADSERVELEFREAELGLKKAQRDYDLTIIVAPFAGMVTSRSARSQRLVNPGDSLFRVTGLRPVLAAVHVPETSAAKIDVGTKATVVALDGREAPARVIRAAPVLDPASGTREIILQLTGSQTRLIPGSNVTVRLGSERRHVVAVPRNAIAPDGYALVWANDKTTLRAVTLGSAIDDERIEVVSGLSAGEKIVRNGP